MIITIEIMNNNNNNDNNINNIDNKAIIIPLSGRFEASKSP